MSHNLLNETKNEVTFNIIIWNPAFSVEVKKKYNKYV